MHTNRILTIAVSAALSLPTISYAAGSFINVDQNQTNLDAPGGAIGKILTGAGPYKPGTAFGIDTNVVVASDKTTGITYASELFGSGSPSALPSGNNKAAVLYTIDGKQIALTFDVTFTLSDGKFASQPELGLASTGGGWNTKITPREGGNGDSKAVFEIKASEAANKSLSTGDQLMFVYQIKDATTLAEGGSVEMTAHLQERYNGALINPQRTVQIASATSALSTVDLRGEDGGTIYISVADESKLFTTKGSAGGDPGAYIGNQVAKIGMLKIKEAGDVVSSDGVTSFKLGGTPTELATEGSQLSITSGQFAASMSSPGKVELVDLSNNSVVVATATVADENTATFDLTDSILETIADSTDKEIAIYMTVDSSTVINTVENPPQATLLIDFKEDNLLDIQKDAVELRQIKKDGTVCVIYNVPNSGAQDKVNMRITNDSSIAGLITAKMYDKDGGAIGPAEGVILNNGQELGAGKTIRLTAADLEAAGFPIWPGRAIMELTSTLPKLEIMNLLRNIAPGSPLTNLSYGASGSACSQ